MVALKTACCCFTLRTGNLILGWFHLIFGVLAIIGLAVMIPLVDHLKDEELPKDTTRHDLKVGLGILIGIMCLSPLFAICHLYGSYKFRKGFLMPYLIGGGIQLGVLLISVIFAFVKLPAAQIVSQIISLLIAIYLYLIPWSFYKELKAGNSPERNA